MFSVDEYLYALQTLHLSETDKRLLRTQYYRPERTCTAGELARALGYTHHATANSLYGKLGNRVGKILDPRNEHPQRFISGNKTYPFSYLFSWEDLPDHFLWIMRPNLARAIEILGIISDYVPSRPDEIESDELLWEGAKKTISVNAYERNAQARAKCIAHYGAVCTVCGFSFASVYGEIGAGYIEVHHLKPIAEVGEAYVIDPIRDLRPICSNCHAMIHQGKSTYSIEELQKIMKSRKMSKA